MPKPSMNGSGEAYQSWNSDHATATAVIAGPRGRLAAADIGFGDELLKVDPGQGRGRGLSAMMSARAMLP